jgi:hypothetical protein
VSFGANRDCALWRQFPNIRDTGLATLLITGVEKSQIASGRRSVGISQ